MQTRRLTAGQKMALAIDANRGLHTVHRFLIGHPISEQSAEAILAAARRLGIVLPVTPRVVDRSIVGGRDYQPRVEARRDMP